MDLLPKNYKTFESKPKGFQEADLVFDPLKKWVTIVLILFVASVLIAGGLWVHQRNLLAKVNELEKQIQNLEKQKDQASVDKFISLEQKLIILRQIFASHVYSSKAIDLIEKSTLPVVQWTNLDLDTKNNILNLTGNANDWLTVAKQITAFEKENLRIINIFKLAVGEEKGINFGLKIGIGDKILKK